MSAYFTSLLIILFTNILACARIFSVPCVCDFLLSPLRPSQDKVCAFPCFVIGRDRIYPPLSFTLLHPPFQNAHQAGEGEEGGVLTQIGFTAACGVLSTGVGMVWADTQTVSGPPGMRLCVLLGARSPCGDTGCGDEKGRCTWGCPKDAPALYVSGWKEDGFYRDNLGQPKWRRPEFLKDTLVPLLKHSHHIQHFPAGLGEMGEDVFFGS